MSAFISYIDIKKADDFKKLCRAAKKIADTIFKETSLSSTKFSLMLTPERYFTFSTPFIPEASAIEEYLVSAGFAVFEAEIINVPLS